MNLNVKFPVPAFWWQNEMSFCLVKSRFQSVFSGFLICSFVMKTASVVTGTISF